MAIPIVEPVSVTLEYLSECRTCLLIIPYHLLVISRHVGEPQSQRSMTLAAGDSRSFLIEIQEDTDGSMAFAPTGKAPNNVDMYGLKAALMASGEGKWNPHLYWGLLCSLYGGEGFM